MKITLYVKPDGTTEIAVPNKDNNLINKLGTASNIVRVGRIIENPAGDFAVEFQIASLRMYNHGAFPSRTKAVAYEQCILNSVYADLTK